LVIAIVEIMNDWRKGEYVMDATNKRINCVKCEHFFVTWDPKFPRGCHAYEIKTLHMPSAAVMSASGIPCQNMQLKINSKVTTKSKAKTVRKF
jgi:hypothetical protein